MTDKELRHLNRSELLQMLITQGEENRRLKEELEEARKQLEHREITLSNAGSIAEAALQLNGVFEAAQKAAQHYLDSIKAGCGGAVIPPVSETANPSAFVASAPVISSHTVPPCEKTEDMSNDEYWKQVRERAQMILGNLS